MGKNLRFWAATSALLLGASVTQASPLPLEGRDINGSPVASNDPAAMFEYDPNTNLTWLRDWNVIGRLPWTPLAVDGSVQGWATSLPYFGGGWSLPTGREYFDLWDELGHALAGLLINFVNVQFDLDPLNNVRGSTYWASDSIAPALGLTFNTTSGILDIGDGGTPHFAVAVRAGDVATSVPEPASLALMGIALAGLAATRRRK